MLARHARPVVEELLGRHGLAVEDVDGWAIHPGGRKIVEVVGEVLDLAEDAPRAVVRRAARRRQLLQRDRAAGARAAAGDRGRAGRRHRRRHGVRARADPLRGPAAAAAALTPPQHPDAGPVNRRSSRPHMASDLRRCARRRRVAACYPRCGERGYTHMTFAVGETVVYPHHGAALIEAIETRTIKGEDKIYLVLKVAQGDLTVRVPADNAEIVGVRDVVGQAGLDKVFEVLRAPAVEEPTNWSRRYKANLEKLASGDINKVGEVVRDLWRRDKERGLSAGEKRMLSKARQILVSELALAEGTNEDKAEAILDEVLAS